MSVSQLYIHISIIVCVYYEGQRFKLVQMVFCLLAHKVDVVGIRSVVLAH